MPTFHSWSNCHEICIIQIVSDLMDKGFQCYLEYELQISEKKKLFVDILAIKGKLKLIFEVGTLSYQNLNLLFPLDRLNLIKKLMPEAKVIHIPQWKNYITVYDCDEELMQWKYGRHETQRVEDEDGVLF